MTAPAAASSQTKRRLKICGDCSCVFFVFTKEEVGFLKEMVRYHGAESMRRWVRMGSVKAPGGGERLDPEKMRIIQLVRERQAYCLAAKSRVQWADVACFLWLPALGNQF